MNDDQPLEPPDIDIDDRSGGERMVAAGRAGVELLGEQRLDFVALIWMLSTIAFVSVQIYSAVNLFGGGLAGFGAWEKVAALGQTGGPMVAVSCLAGIALAALFDTAPARFAMILATLVAAWVLAAGVLATAAAARSTGDVSFGFASQNRAVGVIGGLGLAGFGLAVLLIASAGLTHRTSQRFVSPPQSSLR